MAREMILALGDGDRVGPANFSRVAGDARSQAELVSQAFLGVRLQCANCHDHPLDRWTRDDYHGLAAVFARVDRGRTVRLRERGEVIHPGTGLAASPRIPGERPIPGEGDPREAFAGWLTSPENPYFARAAVNRIWRELMGRGLVEPVDDHRATNPPTHPALLDALARDLVAHGFDTRHTIRTILASEAYRRESRPLPDAPDDDRFYSHGLARPLPPHVLVDAVARVADVPEPLGDLPRGTSGGLAGGLAGRVGAAGPARPLPPRIRLRPDAATGSLGLALHAINGPWLNAKLADPGGRLHRMVREGRDDREIVAEFYRLALGRGPRDEELAHWTREIAGAGEAGRLGALEDFAWALLLSPEFTRNH